MVEMQESDYKIVKYSNGQSVLVISEGVEVIPSLSFKGKEFDKVKFPSSLKRIEDRAFVGCNNLKEVDIPDSVEYIGMYCFNSCMNLSKVKLPENLKIIFPGTFLYCNLSSINIPDSVMAIGEEAFYNASKSGLLEVNLPSNVKVIGNGAFGYITSVKIYTDKGNETVFTTAPDNVTFIGEQSKKIPASKIASYTSKSSYTLTDEGTLIIRPGILAVENFNISNFNNSKAIKKIVFPDSVKYIMDNAFFSMSIESFNIPNNLIYVGERVFQLCTNVENNKVILPNSTLLVGREAFDKDVIVEIPDTCGYSDSALRSPKFSIRKTNGSFNLMDIIDAKKERLKAIGYDCDKVSDNFNSIIKKDNKKVRQLEEMLISGLLTGAIDDDSVEIFTEFIKCGVSPYLMVRADFLHEDAPKFSLIKFLIIKEYTKLITQLFYYGYTVKDDDEKRLLILSASLIKNSNLLELFIALNFPINAINVNGDTPLIIASKCGNYDNVKLLIENNASIIIRNNDGLSALDIARKKNNIEIVKLLEYEENIFYKNELNLKDDEPSETDADILILSRILQTEKP